MNLRQLENLAFSYNEFVWWVGRVVDVNDPTQTGRVKVKIFGYYDKVSEGSLPWALTMHPIIASGLDGIGHSPTGLTKNSTVIGFFADGHDALTPIIIGSIGSNPTHERPRYGSGESDVNRLARGEADDNMIPKKLGNLDVGVPKGFGGTWSEPPTPFATIYPQSMVFEGKGGNIQEFDGTKGAERVNTFHKDGSFEEYHPAGTKVDRIVKDKYSITHKDAYKHVKGDSTITIDGDLKILVGGNAFIEIKGNLNQLVRGNYKLRVDGNFDTEVRGSKTVSVLGAEIHQVGAELRTESRTRSEKVKGDFYIDACGNFDVAAANNYVNKAWVVVGGSPRCDHTDLPPLFPGLQIEPNPVVVNRSKSKKLAPMCPSSGKPEDMQAFKDELTGMGYTPKKAEELTKQCDPKNHGPCWPYVCDDE